MEENNPESAKQVQLPYATEYAKSGRAACKGCDGLIKKDSLRMATRTPSRFFDGYQENWHHFDCFWKKVGKKAINEASIRGLELIKWDDQERIRGRMGKIQEGVVDEEFGTPRVATPKIEHALSARGKCAECKEKVEREALRVGFKGAFYHPKCFRDLNLYNGGAEGIIGFDELLEEEQEQISGLFPEAAKPVEPEKKAENVGPSPSKKPKLEDDPETRMQLKNQSEILWKVRDQFRQNLDKNEVTALLQANGRYWGKGGMDRALDILTDCVVFGTPMPCKHCEGAINYSSSLHSYQCSGTISEYTKCTYTTKEPERKEFIIPGELKKDNEFIASFQAPKLPKRVYSVASNDKILQPKSLKSTPSGSGYGKSHGSGGLSGRVIVKNGCSVDAECDVADVVHVYIDPETRTPWQATLGSTDIHTGRNSFYKLQLLEHDEKKKYYLFRSWGRIGTTQGGSKLEEYASRLQEAKEQFEKLFFEKSQNEWENRHSFKKHPHGMSLLEIDFEAQQGESMQPLSVDKSTSVLAKPIKEVLAMIFDVEAMNKTMKEFQIDLNKMPLGKLSEKQITNAYAVLTVLQDLIKNPSATYNDFLDASNRFFTLIPHSTGLGVPDVLKTPDMIKSKTEMLDSLLEMELAYKIIKSEKGDEEAQNKDPFDHHYNRLHCSMDVVPRDSEEFQLIEKFAKNTKAPTHDLTIQIVDVLRLARQGEAEQFNKVIPNHYLLWHGSRRSNFAGILNQGLRIAPPEAPVTGYMFGKAIYFADCVSKSANCCYAQNAEGFLLLCEVALGEMQEEKDAMNIRKPRLGYQSVKGLGGTFPNPDQSVTMPDGVIVPCGNLVKSQQTDLSLLYNEYMVYDVSQVRMRYLVRVKISSQTLL